MSDHDPEQERARFMEALLDYLVERDEESWAEWTAKTGLSREQTMAWMDGPPYFKVYWKH